MFEKLKRIDDLGNEYWSAIDLSKTLEYSEYHYFLSIIAKAKESCDNNGYYRIRRKERIRIYKIISIRLLFNSSKC